MAGNSMKDRNIGASFQLIRGGRLAVSKLPIRTASVIEVGGAQREEMEKATGEVAAQRRQRSAALDINDWKLPLSVLQLGGFQFGTGVHGLRRESLNLFRNWAGYPLLESIRRLPLSFLHRRSQESFRYLWFPRKVFFEREKCFARHFQPPSRS